MAYQKITNLFDNASNQPSKFRIKYWVEIMINLEEDTTLIDKLSLKL